MGLVNSTYIVAFDKWAEEHKATYSMYENSATGCIEALVTYKWGEFKIHVDDTKSVDELLHELDTHLDQWVPVKTISEDDISDEDKRQWSIIIFYLNNTLDELVVQDFGNTLGMFWYQLDAGGTTITYNIPLARIEKVISKEV